MFFSRRVALGVPALASLSCAMVGLDPPRRTQAALTEHTLSPSRHLGVQMSFH